MSQTNEVPALPSLDQLLPQTTNARTMQPNEFTTPTVSEMFDLLKQINSEQKRTFDQVVAGRADIAINYIRYNWTATEISSIYKNHAPMSLTDYSQILSMTSNENVQSILEKNRIETKRNLLGRSDLIERQSVARTASGFAVIFSIFSICLWSASGFVLINPVISVLLLLGGAVIGIMSLMPNDNNTSSIKDR